MNVTSVESIRTQARASAQKWHEDPSAPKPVAPYCQIEEPAHFLAWSREVSLELLRLSAEKMGAQA